MEGPAVSADIIKSKWVESSVRQILYYAKNSSKERVWFELSVRG